MHPILFQYSIYGHDLIIGTYGVITVAALAAGVGIFVLSGKKLGLIFQDSINCSLIISASAMAGASLAGLLLFLPERISSGFFSFPPILVSWGGIIGGVSAGLLISKNWDIGFLKLGDVSGPAFLTGIGIGRIGCYFGGCCYGIHTDSLPSVVFTHPYAPASEMIQPLLPVQLISAIFLIIGGLVFFILLRQIKISGLILALVSIYYSMFRFIIEFFRADFRKFIFGFSDAQVFSLFLFTAGLLILAYITNLKFKA
jgi:phosphatidylglycerol---prolipoprotein diacylglyceryl transferase